MSDRLDAGVEIRIGRLFWVGLYLTHRKYGGPEEGGWFFDQATLITDPDLYARLRGAPAAFFTEADANAHAGTMRADLSSLNAGRRELGSVLSDGRYDVEVIEAAALPAIYPENHPRYE